MEFMLAFAMVRTFHTPGVDHARLAEELSYGLADPIHLRRSHADEQRQGQAFPRISVRNWEALGIGHEAGQCRLGMQGGRIMETGFDPLSLQMIAKTITVLAAHDIEVKHMVMVDYFRQHKRQAGKPLAIGARRASAGIRSSDRVAAACGPAPIPAAPPCGS